MYQAELAEIDYVRDIARRLETTGRGFRTSLVERAAEHLGVSTQTMFKRLRAVGYLSGRKLRSDKNDSAVSDDQVRAFSAMLVASQRANGKILLPTGDAIDIAVANGVLSCNVSVSTMLRRMSVLSCHPAQLARPEPHVTMRSLHPNHVWQLDASICVLYYLRDGKVRVMDERKFNARKPADLVRVANKRVLRYVLTDHCSGTIIARYYNVTGENAETLFEFLMWAMQPREGSVMHGVPFMLVWDAGAANMAHQIQHLLTALAVRHYPHVPGNPRAKGQVETSNNIVERKFEGRLSFVRIESVEELNAHLDTWLRGFNGAAEHTRTKHTRWAVWQTIRTEQLRLCPALELCRSLLFQKPQPRAVKGNLTVQFKARGAESLFYSVAAVPDVRVGDQVTVTVNPYHAPNIFVAYLDEHGATRYVECEPVALDRFGFPVAAPVFGESYAAQADTPAEDARKAAYDLAYGERETLDAQAAKAKGAVAFDGAIDPFKDARERAANVPDFIARRGTAMDVPSPVVLDDKPLDLVSALKELRFRLDRPLAAEETAALREQFPQGIPETELDAIAERLRNPQPNVERPRLVAIK